MVDALVGIAREQENGRGGATPHGATGRGRLPRPLVPELYTRHHRGEDARGAAVGKEPGPFCGESLGSELLSSQDGPFWGEEIVKLRRRERNNICGTIRRCLGVSKATEWWMLRAIEVGCITSGSSGRSWRSERRSPSARRSRLGAPRPIL